MPTEAGNVTTGLFLVADLQVNCYKDEHLLYVLALTIPQILAYIIGLPAAGVVLLMRNKKRLLQDKSFRMRYGFLYFGYRKERAWWEAVICVRKVFIVLIGTFGTMLNSVYLQA